MSILSGMTNDIKDVKQDTDHVPSGKYGVVDSGLYNCTVEMAYIKESAKGAIAVALTLKDENGHEIKEDLWIQSGNAKGNKNYYEGKNGKAYLPGFTAIDSLCLLATGKALSTQDTEEKAVKVWSYDAKTDVPTQVQVLVDLLDKPITVGVLRKTVDKTAEGPDGEWHPTGEHIDRNEINKFFRAADRLTTAEIRSGTTEGAYCAKWDTLYSGITKDETSRDSSKIATPQSQTDAFADKGTTDASSKDTPTASIFAVPPG
jgi:hypothetical protein